MVFVFKEIFTERFKRFYFQGVCVILLLRRVKLQQMTIVMLNFGYFNYI